MSRTTEDSLSGLGLKNTHFLIRQMKDYAEVGKKLILQRQMTFIAALGLAGYYYSLRVAVVTALMIVVSEVYDYFVFRDIIAWKGRDPRQLRKFMAKLVFGTILSAATIAFYTIAVAYEQGPGAHFMPLFFLFAAALFAGMNNHQLLPILILRLSIYGIVFIYIPVVDIVTTGASIDSDMWAQLFTSLFVLYFVVDCSRIYLSFYRTTFNQLEALKAEHKTSQDALKTKSEFLSTMSHELRTPLTSIKGSIDLAHAGHLGKLPDTAQQVIGIAQRNCTRLITLIDEILDLQKIESGKMSFSMEPVDLAGLVDVAVASTQPFAERLGVTLTFLRPAEACFVSADSARLEQVLTNILSNAAKFSPENSTVKIQIERIEARLRVSVIDEGFGLDEEDRAQVFDKFSQLDASDARKVGGTGLGMNISKRIMQAHDGVIDYRRNPDKGTTFFFELAAYSKDDDALLAAE